MEVVLLHGSDAAAGAWQQSGAVAIVLIAAQLLTEVDAAGPSTDSPSRPVWRRQNRVTCLLAQVDLVAGVHSKQKVTHSDAQCYALAACSRSITLHWLPAQMATFMHHRHRCC